MFTEQLKHSLILDTSARTAYEAASSLGCEVGAIIKSLLFINVAKILFRIFNFGQNLLNLSIV